MNYTILDLGTQPLANSYHKGEHLEEYPLALNLCDKCFHLQLSVVVDPDLMFKNYLYVSGTSKTLRDYFDDFAVIISKFSGWWDKAEQGKEPAILDIACNDGSQLDSFKKLGWKTFGVDPAENLHPVSTKKGHHVVCDYWNAKVAAQFDDVDLITAQNVFAHTHDIFHFLETCKLVMHSETQLYIQTSQADMIPNGEFDTIYHEHLSFFNLKSMMAVAQRAGLVVSDIFKTIIHGNSYVFVLELPSDESRTSRRAKGRLKEPEAVSKEYKKEEKEGRYSVDTYVKYGKNCIKIVEDLKKIIDDAKVPVIGYGAAAKGNTLLNFGKIKLDYIVDDNPLKWDLLTPGMNIPIKDPKNLSGEGDEIVVVPLAWNFYKEISANVKNYRPDNKDTFVRYFPELKIEVK